MEMKKDLKKGLAAMVMCHVIWGVQPLYWNVMPGHDAYFLMAARVMTAALTCLSIVAAQGKLAGLKTVFTQPRLFFRELVCSVFLLIDWVVYLVAVRNGHVFECALGYFIMPLAVFLSGALIFKEKVKKYHLFALALVVCGIVLSARGFGGLPVVTIVLASAFSVYSAVKKGVALDSAVSTTAEILLMLPAAIAAFLLVPQCKEGLSVLDFKTALFLLGGGAITGLPMVFFAAGIKNITMMTAGLLQYLSPSIALVCGVFLGEGVTRQKLISFLFIWAGLAVYAFFTAKEERGK